MIELLTAIADRFANDAQLQAAIGDEWVHGTFEDEDNVFPRVSFRFVPGSGPPVKNTGTTDQESQRVRFQVWATSDIEAATIQRLLEAKFYASAPVLTGPAFIQQTYRPALDLFQEPEDHPEHGEIWQAVLDVEYRTGRDRLM